MKDSVEGKDSLPPVSHALPGRDYKQVSAVSELRTVVIASTLLVGAAAIYAFAWPRVFPSAALSNSQQPAASQASEKLTAAAALSARSGEPLPRCKNLLKRLSIKCTESDKEIVGAALSAEEKLERLGFEEELLPILEGLDAVIPASPGNSFFRNVSAYWTLREQGRTHEAACLGVPLFLKMVEGVE